MACYDANGNISGGLFYYLTSPRNLLGDVIAGTLTRPELIRGGTYLLFMSAAAMIFSVFWVSTSGMDAGTVAEQIESTGMYIPGYRSDKKTMQAILNKYIPSLALLGGLSIGLLASLADFTGAIGTGTGILLTTMIVYNIYEELSRQNLDEAHPLLKKFLE
jgi:preprotein translocase subunit SecY